MYLLDTHVVLWWFFNDPQLSYRSRAIIEDGEQKLFVSAASAWEISTKHRIGKLPKAAEAVDRFEELLRQARMESLAISMQHGLLAGSLVSEHRDPFDRMIVTQAQLEKLAVISADPVFKGFGIEVVW
ncbi:MAG: type II toxin-antitoxin system VapC family toxin [Pseudomonadales bacterium]|jgi:PIN domain nuclease of toxin-antitoxin system|nr:type II toxin-antitoxin system VapC family toxin [Pseudomonadales bacterium]MDP7595575.1 type II toxin-antitoxin system VapC family toxin [Pseudomonadales bacterium]HJN52602.1 type II toxin-antitoxin system VapC family toxin [Pseudomonadales bacterium]|tara:strand:+ start:116 stop:499 length:384 start_codon:yes stop_codon:yes gene_type:complete